MNKPLLFNKMNYRKSLKLSQIKSELKKIKKIGKVAMKRSTPTNPVAGPVQFMMEEANKLEKTMQKYRKSEPTTKFILALDEIHKDVRETRIKLEQSFEELRGA